MVVLLLTAIISVIFGVYFFLKKGEGFEQFANQIVLGLPFIFLGTILLIVFFVAYLKRKNRMLADDDENK
ncbi:hypothetical protein [Paenibacillus cremeus]|uniref:Uncharacterized protein n=1 Tax=Paenibacillus cremeus TaxID=2163881 RepID=A0A559JVQ2_9BACL|nr:hypothetical protein [Paenibacillus cremeus]TVY03971.1 hypothetical protein FPZ49_31085 [Paenibacillus cremeus]